MIVHVVVHDRRDWKEDVAEVVAVCSSHEQAVAVAEAYVANTVDPETDAEVPDDVRRLPEAVLAFNKWSWYRGLAEEGSAVWVTARELDAPVPCSVD